MTDSRWLIDGFFNAHGRHPGGRAIARQAAEHFGATFVRSNRADTLESLLAPQREGPRVLIVEGHPRSGKTWGALGAVRTAIEGESLSPRDVWTSGLDSLGVCGPDTTLLEGFEKTCESLDALESRPRIVFLDDLFGTNTLRTVRVSEFERLASYLHWDPGNPLVDRLRPDATLVLTGRSLFFTLVDLLLGLAKGVRAGAETLGFGVFGGVNGVVGAFDPPALDRLTRLNLAHHPYLQSGTPWKSRDPVQFVLAVPLVAFAPDVMEEIATPDETSRLAAKVFFEEDMDTVANVLDVLRVAERDSVEVPGLRTKVNDISKLHLTMVAPGIVFLGGGAWRLLTLRRHDEFRRSLFYSPADIARGRLPNALYMCAVDKHMARRFSVVLDDVAEIVSDGSEEDQDRTTAVGIALRGLIERGLHPRLNQSLTELVGHPKFQFLRREHANVVSDPLLRFELAAADGISSLVTENPIGHRHSASGVVAAVGWSLKEFFLAPEFDDFRHAVVGQFLDAFRREEIPPEGAHDAATGGDTLLAAYSTFLQWLIYMVQDDPASSSKQLDLVRVLETGGFGTRRPPGIRMDPTFGERLDVVRFDEVLWAVSKRIPLPGIHVAKYVDVLWSGHEQGDSADGRRLADSPSFMCDAVFSLVWHNEWMESTWEERYARQWEGAANWKSRAGTFLASRMATVLARVRDSPAVDENGRCTQVLHNNLQYHWVHFVTQRAVWMRDWCFQDDPDVFERSTRGIDEGGGDNGLLAELAVAVVGARPADCCLRNILFLVGTRVGRLPAETSRPLRALLDQTIEAGRFAPALGAIFELARQEYFVDGHDRYSTDAERSRWGEFQDWCRAVVEQAPKASIADAWMSYSRELRSLSHAFDVLPEERAGWKSTLPESWRFGEI